MDYTREDFKIELARLRQLRKDQQITVYNDGRLSMAKEVENLINNFKYD